MSNSIVSLDFYTMFYVLCFVSFSLETVLLCLLTVQWTVLLPNIYVYKKIMIHLFMLVCNSVLAERIQFYIILFSELN